MPGRRDAHARSVTAAITINLPTLCFPPLSPIRKSGTPLHERATDRNLDRLPGRYTIRQHPDRIGSRKKMGRRIEREQALTQIISKVNCTAGASHRAPAGAPQSLPLSPTTDLPGSAARYHARASEHPSPHSRAGHTRTGSSDICESYTKASPPVNALVYSPTFRRRPPGNATRAMRWRPKRNQDRRRGNGRLRKMPRA